MGIRDWALGDDLPVRSSTRVDEPRPVYTDGRSITETPPASLPPQAPPPGMVAWSPVVAPPMPQYHPSVLSGAQGAMPQTPARWEPIPDTCMLVRPGPPLYEQMMACVPDLLPAYEAHHGVQIANGVDAMDLGGHLDGSDSHDDDRGRRYGGKGSSLTSYLQQRYGGMASASCSASLSVIGR